MLRKNPPAHHLATIIQIISEAPASTAACLDEIMIVLAATNDSPNLPNITEEEALQYCRAFFVADCQSIQQMLKKYTTIEIRDALKTLHFQAYFSSSLIDQLSLDQSSFMDLLKIYVGNVNSIKLGDDMFERALVMTIENLTGKKLGALEAIMKQVYHSYIRQSCGPKLLAELLNYNNINEKNHAEFMTKGIDAFKR